MAGLTAENISRDEEIGMAARNTVKPMTRCDHFSLSLLSLPWPSASVISHLDDFKSLLTHCPAYTLAHPKLQKIFHALVEAIKLKR